MQTLCDRLRYVLASRRRPHIPTSRRASPTSATQTTPSCFRRRVCDPSMAIGIDSHTAMTATAAAVAAVMISCAVSFGLQGTLAAWLQQAPLLLLALTIALDLIQATTMQAKVITCLLLTTRPSSPHTMLPSCQHLTLHDCETAKHTSQVKEFGQQIAQCRKEAAQLRLEADRLSGPETFAKAAKLQRQALQLDKTAQRVRRTQVNRRLTILAQVMP